MKIGCTSEGKCTYSSILNRVQGDLGSNEYTVTGQHQAEEEQVSASSIIDDDKHIWLPIIVLNNYNHPAL